MNHGPLLFLGILFTFALSWQGMVVGPQLQLGRLLQTNTPPAGIPYPTARPGLAQEGREVYRANGCYYCHTQQVRPSGQGADLERGWGKRFSVGRDYLYESPLMLGHVRIGGDLANIGSSNRWVKILGNPPNADTDTNLLEKATLEHLRHLYNPQITAKGSTMPPYSFLFETRKVRGQPSASALPLTGEFAPEPGFEVIPTREAHALVAYLQSLQAEASLFEAPMPLPGKRQETAGGDTNQPPASASAPSAGAN